MTLMEKIPADIDAIITRVDRRHEEGLLPRTDTPKDKYDRFLAPIFPKYQLVNLTEFDYGRSYRYQLVLSSDPDAAALDRKKLAQAVKRSGSIEFLDLAISVIAPYCLLRYVRYTWQQGKVQEQRSDRPFSPALEDASRRVLGFLQGYRIHALDPAIAALPVPDVQTDLMETGEATVSDCLFTG